MNVCAETLDFVFKEFSCEDSAISMDDLSESMGPSILIYLSSVEEAEPWFDKASLLPFLAFDVVPFSTLSVVPHIASPPIGHSSIHKDTKINCISVFVDQASEIIRH